MSCSSATENNPSAESTLHTPSAVVQMTQQGTRIFGPQLELVRDDAGIRGQSSLGVVDLRKQDKDNSIRGMIGGGVTELHVQPTQAGFEMRGMFRGALGAIELEPRRIEGQLGRCQYDLHSADDGTAYSGLRLCGRARETASLTLSPDIKALPLLDRAALIAILLGR